MTTKTGEVGPVLPGGTTGGAVVVAGGRTADTEFGDPEELGRVKTVVFGPAGAVSIGETTPVSAAEDEGVASVELSKFVESEVARSVETESGREAQAEASATMTRHAPRSVIRVLFMSESDDWPAGLSRLERTDTS